MFANGPTEFAVPAATRKTIISLDVYNDPPDAPSVMIVFTDGTDLVVDSNMTVRASAKHYQRTDTGPTTLSQYNEGGR